MSDVDITKYPEGIMEIIKHMDYLPDDDEARINFVMGFVLTAMIEAYV